MPGSIQELSQDFRDHKKEDSDNFGRLFNELKRNTDLTEAVVQRQSGLSSDLQSFSTFMGEVREFMRGNIVYMKNMEERIVEGRKETERLKEEVSFAKGAAKFAGLLWGTVSAVIVGTVTYWINKN